MEFIKDADPQLNEIFAIYAHMGERRTDMVEQQAGYVVGFNRAADGMILYALSSMPEDKREFIGLASETSPDTTKEIAVMQQLDEDRAAHYELAYGRVDLN